MIRHYVEIGRIFYVTQGKSGVEDEERSVAEERLVGENDAESLQKLSKQHYKITKLKVTGEDWIPAEFLTVASTSLGQNLYSFWKNKLCQSIVELSYQYLKMQVV